MYYYIQYISGHLFINFGVCFGNHGDVRRTGSVTVFHINYGNIYLCRITSVKLEFLQMKNILKLHTFIFLEKLFGCIFT